MIMGCGCGQKSVTAITSAQLELLAQGLMPGDQLPTEPVNIGSTANGVVWA